MRFLTISVFLIFSVTSAFAEQWEFGAGGGGGFLNTVSASGQAGAATAGFAPGFAAGFLVDLGVNRSFSGELRYEYLQSDLRLSSAGQTATFPGAAHAIHYDFVYHTSRESRTQFFADAGFGAKIFDATGTAQAYQPLSQFGYFTRTHVLKPMVSAGAGVTYRLGEHVFLRAEVLNFITGFPQAVITPAPGVKFGNLLDEIVPMVSIVYRK